MFFSVGGNIGQSIYFSGADKLRYNLFFYHENNSIKIKDPPTVQLGTPKCSFTWLKVPPHTSLLGGGVQKLSCCCVGLGAGGDTVVLVLQQTLVAIQVDLYVEQAWWSAESKSVR